MPRIHVAPHPHPPGCGVAIFRAAESHGYRILFSPRHEYAVLAGTGHSQIQLQSLMWMSPDGGDHRGSGDEPFTGVSGGGTVVSVSGRTLVMAHNRRLSRADIRFLIKSSLDRSDGYSGTTGTIGNNRVNTYSNGFRQHDGYDWQRQGEHLHRSFGKYHGHNRPPKRNLFCRSQR